MLKVELLVDKKVVQETLNRIGIPNKKDNILYPSCYLYEDEKKDVYLIHFKHLFGISRSDSYNDVTDEDIERMNSIAFCLRNWGMISVEDDAISPHGSFVFIVPYAEKYLWKIKHKINMFTLRNKFNIVI